MNRSGFQKHTASKYSFATRPRVLLSSTRAAYIGQSMPLSPHKRAVATIAIGLEFPFELELLQVSRPRVFKSSVALIPPDIRHNLKSDGLVIFLYLGAFCDDYTEIADVVSNSCDSQIANRVRDAIYTIAPFRSADAQIDAICQALELPERPAIDPRILSVIHAIDHAPYEFTSISQAAEIAGLSVTRFQHIFKAVVGTSFRRYRLWKRMAVVAHALSSGENLTSAAYDAGFSSSAHLSAAFRDMFGIKPSDLFAIDAQFEVDPVHKPNL